MELNLSHFLTKIGVVFDDRANSVEAFKKAQRRRRLMKRQYEENVSKATKSIISKLAMLSDKPVPVKDAAAEKTFKTLLDVNESHRFLSLIFETFNAFDKDGSAELGYAEYCEAWEFLKV